MKKNMARYGTDGAGQLTAEARDAWFKSPEGEQCQSGVAEGVYLRNRLESAFLAGVEAGRMIDRKLQA